MILRVLLAIEPASLAARLRRLIAGPETVVSTVRANRSLWARLPREDADLVVVSRSALPRPAAPMIESIRELPEHPEVIVFTEVEDAEARASLLTAGCMAVVYRDLPDPTIAETLGALLRRCRDDATRRLRETRAQPRGGLEGIVARSPAMQQFLSLARRVVESDSSLLIMGETGVGKERLAQAIHVDGPRASGPFLPVNCAALPESLLESELFGHEEGAFTGASRSRRGYFEIAHGGTLFLDEIGDLPPHLQVKLLRVLQERTIQRVGGERPLAINVRVMAATNRHLENEVRAHRFRPDLYYRLAVVTLTLPPLRERREDIPELVASNLDQFRMHLGRPVRGVARDALAALCAYDWPGNVRELINVVERAVLLCAGSEIGLADLPASIIGEGRETPAPDALLSGLAPGWAQRPLREVRGAVLDAVEVRYLREQLEQSGGRVGEAARRAGITERALYNLMRRHGLRKESFRSARPD